MKYKITREKIELDYTLYKIIIPNDSTFKCVITDQRKSIGANNDRFVNMGFLSKQKKYTPWFGVVIHFFRRILDRYVNSMDISGLKTVNAVSEELKINGYRVDDIVII